ncbi:membrane cofactor protein-like isoform X1 [Eptesicus fuscus]|uniref:membrane cofactor protein-like isoform X1 n=1 Tax=Eptesicus fuscus TaxID=29078 RepID=UPI002403AC86|nr:membrane cofactor protein-like isoform X1 [Eptesicus fuscus]XP_054567727.1 membrane cofactor protein-like isoform X1 [Eptesicus fuscus]
MSRTMTASYQPRRASSRRLESPFSWGFLGVLLLALELLLPMCSDACCDLRRFESMKPKGDPAPPYNPGYQIKYECRPGYRRRFPVLPTSAVCQPDNTWAPALQEACTKKSCPQPREPPNGKIVYVSETMEFGSQAHYACNQGYYLVGAKILHCELSGNDVEWSEEPPRCEKILCQPPPQITNGEFSNSHKDTFEYNEVVTYRCKPSNGPDEYSLVGESKLVCSGPNGWSPDPPECKVVKCEYPALENGRLVSGFGKKFQYKSKVTFECLEGFSLEGSSTIVCEADSTWEPEIPKCIKEDSKKMVNHQLGPMI